MNRIKWDKYFDLAININDQVILCHRIVICEESPFIKMLVERSQIDSWPPVNEIDITLPNNINIDDFRDAIKFLYRKEGKYANIIDSLLYLCVRDGVILDLITESFPNELDDKYIDILTRLLDTNAELRYLHSYYYKELKDKIALDNDNYLFGNGFDIEEIYNKKKDCIYNDLDDYSPPIDSKWIHLTSLDSAYKFEFSGINFILRRFTYSFNYDDNEEFIKLYSNGDESEDIINLRVALIIFSVQMKPGIDIRCQKSIIPKNYTVNHVLEHLESHRLGFPIPFHMRGLRFSILIEKY
jgi:hypothetical protein